MKREEAAADANLSLYLRSLSHDFNNLLAAILGNASLLATLVPENSEAARTAQVIERAAQRGAELTAHLARAARLEPPRMEAADLASAAGEVAALLRAVTPEPIAIETALAPAPVYGDPTELHQLAMNLALNARDALKTGGVIAISTGASGSAAVLAVRDSGPGISAEIRERIFEPFFSTKGGSDGYRGMGLAIVDRVARRHGAKVELISEPGHGAEFRVVFPLRT